MATASFNVCRITINLTDAARTWVEVDCGPTSDGTLGVEGTHRREYPAMLPPDQWDGLWEEVRTLKFLTSPLWQYTPAEHIAQALDLGEKFVMGDLSLEDYVAKLTAAVEAPVRYQK